MFCKNAQSQIFDLFIDFLIIKFEISLPLLLSAKPQTQILEIVYTYAVFIKKFKKYSPKENNNIFTLISIVNACALA